MCKVVGILYVDGTNLWAAMEEEDDLDKAVYKAQENVAFWGRSLIATRGTLNPGKCKWSIHDLIPKEDGTWEYRRCKPQLLMIKEGEVYPGTVQVERGEEEDDSTDALWMTIPQASGPEVVITQLQSCQAMKNLGLYTPPEGSSDPQLEAKQDSVDNWTAKMRAGGLPARSAWLR